MLTLANSEAVVDVVISDHGGTRRPVHVGYADARSGSPGPAAGVAVLGFTAGLVYLGLGAAVLAVLAVPGGLPVLGWLLLPGLAAVAIGGYGVLSAVRAAAVASAVRWRVVDGLVIHRAVRRLWNPGRGVEYDAWYVAVDDGSADRVVAWRVPWTVALALPVGSRVRARVSSDGSVLHSVIRLES